MNVESITKTIPLKGLTCSSCEARIRITLEEIPGVISTQVSYKTQILKVTYDAKKTDLEQILLRVYQLGYTQREEKKSNTLLFVIAGVTIFSLFLLVELTIGFDYLPQITNEMGYMVLFIVGLLTSVHCIAMCGGVNLSVCIGERRTNISMEKGMLKRIKVPIAYHMGRVVSYTIIGGIFGAIGSVFSISPMFSAGITFLAGVFMIMMGFRLLDFFPVLRRFSIKLPQSMLRLLHQSKKGKLPFVVGLINGFMPCGPLQAMQLYALGTGSFFLGAISLFFFSLGTVPLLLLFSVVSSYLSTKFTKTMLKMSAVLIILLGFILFFRGVRLTGYSPDLFKTKEVETITNNQLESKDRKTTQQEEVQIVEFDLSVRGYTPITVKKDTPVKWIIHANSTNLTGCNRVLYLPEYGIKKELVEGDNTIEFTPDQTGTFGYSCWMGMIQSTITVIEDSQ